MYFTPIQKKKEKKKKDNAEDVSEVIEIEWRWGQGNARERTPDLEVESRVWDLTPSLPLSLNAFICQMGQWNYSDDLRLLWRLKGRWENFFKVENWLHYHNLLLLDLILSSLKLMIGSRRGQGRHPQRAGSDQGLKGPSGQVERGKMKAQRQDHAL